MPSPQVRAAVWRVALQTDIFRSLGYRFLLQHGDDAFVAGRIRRDLVADMAGGQYAMGGAWWGTVSFTCSQSIPLAR